MYKILKKIKLEFEKYYVRVHHKIKLFKLSPREQMIDLKLTFASFAGVEMFIDT